MKPWRNKKYLEFVRTLVCSNCKGKYETEAHHVRGIGNMAGVGMKAPDWATMPLCNGAYFTNCHDNMQNHKIDKTLQWEYIGKTMIKALSVGKLGVDDHHAFVLAIGKMIDDGVLTVR